jgi:hypothetical protein
MANNDNDLTHMFVRDLDDIELPPRNRWRPMPKKESYLVTTTRFVLSATAVAAVLALGLIASSGLRDRNQAAASPSRTSTPTAPTATATLAAVATTSPTPAGSPVPGAITGRIPYPAGFQPALTIYAISVADQSTYFSVSYPRYAEGTTGPGKGTYTLTGVTPGTYYVLAYRDSDPTANDQPGLYSQYVIRCVQPSLAGSTVPQDCDARTGSDHVLVPVAVAAGQTASGIDVGDWGYERASYPSRPR